MSDTKRNSDFLKFINKTSIRKNSLPDIDITGLTLSGYRVIRKMRISSGEADIYGCIEDSGTDGGAGEEITHIIKFFRRKNAVKPEVFSKLMTIKNPCVAPVCACDVYQDHQYVVRPYYVNNCLGRVLEEGGRFLEEHLREIILPSVIEGLKTLHDAGIIHKDLKPDNLIPDDNGEHVVLIDFGISSDAGNRSIVLTQTGMTPGYAAPEALQGTFLRETDYYALGITVFQLVTGYIPFQNPGLTSEENARMSLVNKIEFPEDFPESLRDLVLGLTFRDITHRDEPDNPNRRWGYDEVRRWLAGEKVPVPGKGSQAVSTPVFKPYTLNGRVYKTERELITGLLSDYETGLKELGRGKLADHYESFDDSKADRCRLAGDGIRPNDRPHNLRIYNNLMYQLCPEITAVFCAGKEYPGFLELGDAAVEEAALNNGDFEEYLTDLYEGESLSRYAKNVAKSQAAEDILKNVAGLLKIRSYTSHEKTWILGYAFSKRRKLVIHGVTYETPEDFFKAMADLEEADFPKYARYTEECKKDLEFFAAAIPEKNTREKLRSIFDDRETAIFDKNEYHFKNGAAFGDYVAKLVREEKVYELRRLFDRYGDAILELSKTLWRDDSFNKLKKACDDMVFLDEYLFRSEKDLKTCLQNLIAKYEATPDYFRRFSAVHEKALRELSKRPALANELKRISELGKIEETYLNVYVNGTQYPTEIPMKVGDIYTYGNYRQNDDDDDGTKTPIEWLVLAREDKRALLISRYGLDCRQYHGRNSSITWRGCSLRSWFNWEFLKEAFTKDEQKRVLVTHVSNADRNGGSDTEDQLFCLSSSEAEKYFKSDAARKCRPTDYARSRGCSVSDDGCYWWLRSPGFGQGDASDVNSDGALNLDGNCVNNDGVAVRPAFWINLKSVIF